ncbi:replication initiation regulator SeqA [Actinobacillus porcinus]|uniref:Negative modulator of initiation of replication n=1 Tax=Actinobacillus porcinus TaxID=51048 RepID=A0ABY6TIJ3_9PAST|nr:replication initiation negative regulator SeqA [Actinobacillus porcinus]VFY92576.1 replication initiation regulator SeqA [Actinobacillus porcinus]VTU06837.1 replication initiation regulator SeqA [Actinobacillus porcinus]
MKIIEVDEELYQFIASKTQSIGESASDILRRLLNLSASSLNSNSLDLQLSLSASENIEPSLTDRAEKNTIVSAPVSAEITKSSVKKQPEQAIQKLTEKVQNLLASASFQEETKAVVRFLSILTALYRTNPESFAVAIESEQVQGRTRVYFARDEATLLASGNHTKPKQIPDTPYWVITNNNSGRKMIMLEGVMREMHLPESLIDDVRNYFVTN